MAIAMTQLYDLEQPVSVLRAGGLILYPTDSIWGIGCDATDDVAVLSVFHLKQRPFHKPLVSLVSDIDMLKNYVPKIHPRIETLLAHHERPLTIIYENVRGLAPLVVGKGGTAAIRLPQDRYCRDLIRQFGKPLVATSANVSDRPFPAHFGEVTSDIIQGVDHVCKHRQWDKRKFEPSVIARLGANEELEFLR